MKNKEAGIGFNINCIIISVTIFAILTMLVLYMPNIRTIDSNVLHSIRLALSPYPAYIPVIISGFGMENYMIWPQITAISVMVSHKLYTKSVLLLVFMWLAYTLKSLIKNYVCRERPTEGFPGFSFPSGHTTMTMCFYGIMIYLVHRYVSNNFWRNFLITLFSIWIFLVAVSRMWLGAHFLIDVIAGALLGFTMINLYIITCKVLKK